MASFPAREPPATKTRNDPCSLREIKSEANLLGVWDTLSGFSSIARCNNPDPRSIEISLSFFMLYPFVLLN